MKAKLLMQEIDAASVHRGVENLRCSGLLRLRGLQMQSVSYDDVRAHSITLAMPVTHEPEIAARKFCQKTVLTPTRLFSW